MDQPLNWSYFLAETFDGNQFFPPLERTKTQARSEPDWRAWREEVWDQCTRADFEPSGQARGIPGMDPEAFPSMHQWPRLQGRCAQGWPDFLVWWRQTKPLLVAEIDNVEVHHILSDERAAHSPLTLHVVALADAQDLASRGEHHLISVGLLRDRERFRNWLRQQA